MGTIQINSGEHIGMRVLTIRTIPHMSTISASELSAQETNRILVESARDMSNLLSEIYQQYKLHVLNGETTDIALEMLWVTESVQNQPYKAKINLYLLLRYIHSDQNRLQKTIDTLYSLTTATLGAGKYEFEEISIDTFSKSISNIKKMTARAIVKEERLEDLQNSYFPTCYAYDVFPTDYTDLSRIVNVLTDSPNCAVSFQLIPTFFNADEITELNRVNQNVNMLSQGMQDQNVGSNISISAAGRVAKLYHYYADNKERALFTYNIVVYGDEPLLANVSSRVLGQLNSTQTIAPNLRFVDLGANTISDTISFFSQPWILNEQLINSQRNPQLWTSGLVSAALYRFPYIITAEEAALIYRLPIGSDRISAGLQVNETSKTSRTYSQNLINAGDIQVGILKSSSGKNSIGFSLKDLAKHMLIVGTPGSGKTTFSVGLLDRLWKDHHIPFLVIEPAKNEYRSLIQSIPDLQVFTPGKNFISPFVFNPFVPPKNVRLETYKNTLKTAFAAGVSMSTPLDKIFEDTINNCYSDFRWLDSYTKDNKGQIFNISDFIKCFQETFDEIGYTGDARNIGRAGIVRLKSLANLFDNYFSIPIEDILTKPTIIELAAIENSDQKALIIALLLLSILAYVNANYVGEGGLRNFILLEEAHVLLDTSSNGGEGAANPAAIAQGLVKRMLAEIRSYGVGIGIADQSPRKVGIDIVALTDIKVAFRLVENEDKQILADSTSMTDLQTARLAKLKPGEAFLFFNKLDEPEEVVTPDYRLNNNISISLSDDGIRQLSTYWNNKKEKLRPFPQCALTPYCKECCIYEQRLLAKEIARRIYKKNLGATCSEYEKLKEVFMHLSKLTKSELNDEPFSKELLSCVKVHLLRKVKYETKINISDETINNTLIKE